jgi:hypothetical protein
MLSWLRRNAVNDVDLSMVANDNDRRILEVLRRRGDTLRNARHVMFHFYRLPGDERATPVVFAPLAQEATALGLRIREQRHDALVLETEQTMTPDMVNAARRLMEDWAEAHGVAFDGWETALAVKRR